MASTDDTTIEEEMQEQKTTDAIIEPPEETGPERRNGEGEPSNEEQGVQQEEETQGQEVVAEVTIESTQEGEGESEGVKREGEGESKDAQRREEGEGIKREREGERVHGEGEGNGLKDDQPLATDTSTTEVQGTTSGEDGGGTAEDKEGNSGKASESRTLQESKPQSGTNSQGTEKVGDRGLSSGQKRREKRRKKKSSVPKLRRQSSSKIGNVAEQYLQAILLSYFQSMDPFSTELIYAENFFQILYSQELNLQLSEDDLQLLQTSISYDEQGMVLYMDFVANAQRMITSLYSQYPDIDANWTEIRGADGTKVVYNKKSGEIIDHAEDGMDLFEVTIKDLFNSADIEGKGVITRENFTKLLKSKLTDLREEQVEELASKLPEGDVTFKDFQATGKEAVLKIYQVRDQTDSDWMQLNSPNVGTFYLNKFTGETKRDMGIPEEREQEAALIQGAYSQISNLTLELEHERHKVKEFENQVALANEELEAVVTQLDETGRQLDDANNELQAKEEEIAQLHSVISEQKDSITQLHTRGDEVTSLEAEIQRLHQELIEAHRIIQDREVTIGAKEQSMQDLSLTIDAITDELKNAHGIIDARDSNIASLHYTLTNEQGKVKELHERMPSLETRLSAMVTELRNTQKNLDEKTSILQQTRRQLKIAREKNSDLNKEVTQLSHSNDKLRNAESEIRTLKSFLTSKTAMIEKRKKDIHELREKISDLESRDNRRAVILADVLEKTARAYQHQLYTTSTSPLKTPLRTREESDRPISAPIIPLEDLIDYQEDPLSLSYQFPQTTSHFMHQRSTYEVMREDFSGPSLVRRSPKKKSHIKARSVPRLPPIKKQRPQFIIPTELEIKQSNKKSDNDVTKHVPTNADCKCELCAVNRGEIKKPAYLSRLTDQTALQRLKQETEDLEYQLAQQIKIGQRVLIQVKKSMYDLEPQKLSGIVKFVGKVDSEYVDNRIYVGVKLDEPVGNTDGVFKGKKYFSCPPGHGKMVRITNVISVMPNKSIVYKPLQVSGSQHQPKKLSPSLQVL